MDDQQDPEFDAELDAVLIGGREDRELVVVDYSPDWPVRFDAERARIAAALGAVARRIEHVGSTAVPGLAAKAIVDILVTVDDAGAEECYRPQLEAAGYVLRVRERDHRMFRTPELDVHVHVWGEGSEEPRRVLAFRDRLRSDAAARAEYERAKRALADQFREMNYYARAKGPIIERILGT